jgi:hypothetical protein
MDPVTALGAASAALSIVSTLVPTLLSLKNHWSGIRNIDETNTSFLDELDSFQFSLVLIDTELRQGTAIREISGWWDADRLTNLLTNATKTMSRLDAIFRDITKRRMSLPKLRSYYRASMYDKEIGHLMVRVKTYTSCLSVPAMLIALYVHSCFQPV